MAIGIADNFLYQGRKPLDSRIVKDTIADMIGMAESIIYEGIMVYNKETEKYYVFNSSNSVDSVLAKWREFSGSETNANATISEYEQNKDYKKNELVVFNNKMYLVANDFKSDNNGATVDDSFKTDLDSGKLVIISSDTTMKDTHSVEYKTAQEYKKGNLLVFDSKLYIALQDFTADDTETAINDSFKKDITLGNIIAIDTNVDTNCIEYAQNIKYTIDKLVKHNNNIYIVVNDFTADNIEANSDLSFEKDLSNGNLLPVVSERKVSKVLQYTQATQYDKDTLVYVGSKIARVDVDYTSDATQTTIEDSFDFDVANNKLILISAEDLVAVLPYMQDTDYLENSLVFLNEKIARVVSNYHSDNTAGNTLEQSFESDIKNNKISLINTDHVQIMNQYAQSNMYFKDTLVYNGNLITRVMKDFIADSTEANVDDSFDKDVTAGNLLVLNKEAELRNTSIQTRNFIL